MADPVHPTTTTSKSEKYNQAVSRATGKTVDTGQSTAPIGNAAAMFSKFEPEQLNEMAKSGKFEFAPQMMTIEPGMKIEGILEGYGAGNLFTNPDTGEQRFVDSWIIASHDGALRVSILSGSQLDTKLPPFLGLPVIIARNAEIKLAGGHRCGDYHVGGPRLANGERRRWGTDKNPAALAEAAARADEAHLLAAGAIDAASRETPAISNGANPTAS